MFDTKFSNKDRCKDVSFLWHIQCYNNWNLSCIGASTIETSKDLINSNISTLRLPRIVYKPISIQYYKKGAEKLDMKNKLPLTVW